MTINKICSLARAVIIDHDYILLCKTRDLENNFYFLPGGHIEHNETAQQALKRELLEETGFGFKIGNFLGCLEHIFAPRSLSLCHNHEYNFIFKAESRDLDSTQPIPKIEHHIDVVWVQLNYIENINLKPAPLKRLIDKWYNASVNGTFESSVTEIDK
jgi:8-oxo-dGTP diphosphatase